MSEIDQSQTIEIGPQPGKQTDFADCRADVAIYGGHAGAGKSWGLIFEPVVHLENPKFGAVIFRRTSPEITNEGGLWDEAAAMYPIIGGMPNINALRYTFPSGSRVSFRHIQYEKDLLGYQGAQIPLIEFDQLEHFTRKQFFYMLSRNRSTCGIRPYVRATCNPRPNWLADFLSWWIDQDTGYAIEERSGIIRYFVHVGDQVHWGDTREELAEKFPDFDAEHDIKSCTFIVAKLTDNQILMKKDPGYRANLLAQTYVERERLLKGNWHIRDTDGTEWPGEYFADIYADDWPDAFELSAIAVDPSKGTLAPSTLKPLGDPSAIVFVGLARGMFFVDPDIDWRPVEKIITDGAEMARESWPDAFGVEANAFQELMAKEYDRLSEHGDIPPLPLYLINNQINKRVRIRRIGPYLKRGKLRIRRTAGGRRLLEQLSGFPLPDVHDDGPDALEMAIRLITNLVDGSLSAENLTIGV